MTVRCANRKMHEGIAVPHHEDVATVKICFATPGGIPTVEEGHVALSPAQVWASKPSTSTEGCLCPTSYSSCQGIAPCKGVGRALREAAEQQPCRAEATDGEEPCEGHEHDAQSFETGPSTQTLAERIAASQPEPIYDGIYTVERSDGSWRTLRLRTQAADAKFAPGRQIISYLSGPENTSDYTGFGFVGLSGGVQMWNRFKDETGLRTDAETLLADPTGALKSTECFRCHHPLTVPASLYRGLGPDCARKAA